MRYVRIKVLDYDGEPLTNELCIVRIDHDRIRTGTDANGEIVVFTDKNAKCGDISFVNTGEKIDLVFEAKTKPIEETAGVQMRLYNLGFLCDVGDNETSPVTQTAIRDFRDSSAVAIDDAIDSLLRNELQKHYGC